MGEDLNQEGKSMISQGILRFKIEHTEEHELGYTITADQDPAVKEVIKTVRDWTALCDKDGKPTDREVGTAIHAMAKKGEPFRLVIQRWRDPQLPLFQKPEYCYYVIATNRDDRSPEEVIRFHNERGQAENEIKELKIGGHDQLPRTEERMLRVLLVQPAHQLLVQPLVGCGKIIEGRT